MPLPYQSVLVEVIEIPVFVRRNKDPPSGIRSCLSQVKGKDELLDSLDVSSGLTGLEPAASALTGRCSDQLNYNPW